MGPSAFPAMAAADRLRRPACQTRMPRLSGRLKMVTRADIIWLGVAAGVTGGLVGGMMLGIGLVLVLNGTGIGVVLILPGAPVSGLIGWILARRLARQLDPG